MNEIWPYPGARWWKFDFHSSGGLAIPAHVDKPKGLLCLDDDSNTKAKMDSNTLCQVLETPNILAMEVIDKSKSKPIVYIESGNRWSEVVGSDCHNFRGNAIPGSRYTWVKMAQPSLDGLRLALLDGDGVSVRRSDDDKPFDPFHKPEHFIESIEIHEAYAMGRGKLPAILRFSPYFNAIVGGRGTGKSTAIHAIRLAYRRESELKQFDEKSEPLKTFERFNKVYTSGNKEGGLREDTEIVLTLSRDGVSYSLRWQQNGHGVAVEEDNQPSQSQSITPQRFPLRLFSQGQIAALAGDSQQALLDLIDEAAGTDEEKRGFDDAKNTFLSSKGKLRGLEGKLRERDAVNLALQDVQRKLQRFEEAHYVETLKTYQRSDRQSRESNRQFKQAAEMANKLRTFAAELLTEDLPDGLFDPTLDKQALDIFSRLTQAIAQAKTDLENAANTLINTVKTIQDEHLKSSWAAKNIQAETDYEALKSRLQSEGINDPVEYGRLVQDRQRLELEVKRLDAIQKQIEDLLIDMRCQFHAILKARRAISNKRQLFLQKALADNRYVQIILRPYGCQDSDMERTLRKTLKIEDGFSRDIMDIERQEGIVFDIANAEPKQKAKTIRDIKHKLIEGCQGRVPLGATIRNRLKKCAEEAPEFCDHILCWFPEDGLKVEFSREGNGKDFESITQASAGQRAAAMLAFLLAYGNEPLVLDQPEDDLDNHLIYNLVVEQIRNNKQHRQLIIVTHNPNIVVNGDAEMLYALDFNNQCYVKESGSLQDKKMREEVCRIMEGGHEAFDRRYRRLGREV